MAEQATSESSPDTDRDFDPSAEMLIHDYDDEQTLDEEEAMSNGESVMNELVALQQESEMPMEELLAMYGYGRDTNEPKEAGMSGVSTANEANANSEEETIGPTTTTQPMETDGALVESLENSDPEKSNSEQESVVPSQMAILLTADPMEASTDEDEEDDEDYEPDNDENWKKSVQVGSDYQAVVPEGQEPYGDAPAYEGEDRLLWDPKSLTDSNIEKYLEQVQTHNFSTAQGVHAIPAGSHVRDDEQALYLLLNCELNLDEALRRHKLQSVPTSDPMSLWSEEECRNFELGLRTYGKDFFANQQNKVRTRSVKELVQFYYLWKKTERHDAFAARTRLEKKKYALHPGITDYMDRFLDEHESLSEPHDQMTSPNVRSLLYGDPKRQEGRSSEDFTTALEIVQKVANSSTVDFLLPGKFREDMQTVVLGSIGAHAEPGSELGRYGRGEVQDSVVGPVLPIYGVSLPDSAQATMLPISPPLKVNFEDRVAELDQSDGLPPSKRPRLQSPGPQIPDPPLPGCPTANPKEAFQPSIVALTSACLSPALSDNVSLTSSGVSSATIMSAFVPASGDIPCVASELNDVRSLIDHAPTDPTAGVVLGGPGSFLSSSSALSPSSSGGATVLPFDSFPAGTLAASPDLCPVGVSLPEDDPLAVDSTNPGFQRLKSLDSIEPSLPGLDASIDTYASVLSGPGLALEGITAENLGSMLSGFNPEAPSLISATDPVVTHDFPSTGNTPSIAAASAVFTDNLAVISLTETTLAATADRGLDCSADSGPVDGVVHSLAVDSTGGQNIETQDPLRTKSVEGLPEEPRPIKEVSDNVETAETTLTQAACKDVEACPEQTADKDIDGSVASPDPELIIDMPVSDMNLNSDGEPGRKIVSGTSAAVDELKDAVDSLSGNQIDDVDVAVCEALVTEHGTSALST